MKHKQTDLELIILSYNSEFWLKKLLTSLKDTYLNKTKLQVRTTVVDNNSSDQTLSLIKEEFPWVHVIVLDENVGFSKGNNVALQKSSARYTMLLNSDIECTQDTNFDELVSYMDKHPKVGIITPKVLFSTGEIDPASHRGEPTPLASLWYFMGLESLFPRSPTFAAYHQLYKDFETVHEIEACSGAAMLTRRSAHEQVGLLDERFFMYAEDLDWCKSFRDAGYSVVYYPNTSVIHHKYKSGIKNTSQKIAKKTKFHFYNTMLQYYDKHYADKYPAFVRSLVRYFVQLKKGGI